MTTALLAGELFRVARGLGDAIFVNSTSGRWDHEIRLGFPLADNGFGPAFIGRAHPVAGSLSGRNAIAMAKGKRVCRQLALLVYPHAR